MAKLYYRFSSMNAGKSTALIQIAYNYEERGQKVIIIKPSTDTKDTNVISRLGVKRSVDIHLTPKDNLLTLIEKNIKQKGKIDCILIDEAQFLTREQANQAFTIAVTLGTPVIAYGIRTDFQTNAFPGSARLLEISHSLEELKTICRCGKKAILNGRKINGNFIKEGTQIAIDGDQVEYESLCGSCYIQKVGPIT